MVAYLQMIESPADQWKFEDIYNAYGNLMYKAALGILKNPQDAEDAVHDAFVKIAENIDRICIAVCPKTKGYVVTIVENKAIDIYRRKQNHPKVEYADETVGISVEYTGTNGLTECILKLPPRQRSAIILRYSHGYSIKEVAAILGITYENAMKLDQRAKERLKILCEEVGVQW